MGRDHTGSKTPDLFSTGREQSSSPAAATASTPAIARLVLPKDLPNAIRRLTDHELDQLIAAALGEQQRRGRKPRVSHESSHKQRVEAVAIPLTSGKLNAVRAAFKAGISPSQIARQFGISQSDVRKVLAGDTGSEVSAAQAGAHRLTLKRVAKW
jgi:hypothetical protein